MRGRMSSSLLGGRQLGPSSARIALEAGKVIAHLIQDNISDSDHLIGEFQCALHDTGQEPKTLLRAAWASVLKPPHLLASNRSPGYATAAACFCACHEHEWRVEGLNWRLFWSNARSTVALQQGLTFNVTTQPHSSEVCQLLHLPDATSQVTTQVWGTDTIFRTRLRDLTLCSKIGMAGLG